MLSAKKEGFRSGAPSERGVSGLKYKSTDSSLFYYSRGSTLAKQKSKEKKDWSGRASRSDLTRMEEELTERVENEMRIKGEIQKKKNSMQSSFYHELEDDKTIRHSTAEIEGTQTPGEVRLRATHLLANEDRIMSLR